MIVIDTERRLEPDDFREHRAEPAGPGAIRLGSSASMLTIPRHANLVITDRDSNGSAYTALFDEYVYATGSTPWGCSGPRDADPTGTIADEDAYGWHFSKVPDPELFVDKLNRWQANSNTNVYRNRAAPLQQE